MKKIILSILMTSTFVYGADNDRLQSGSRPASTLKQTNPIYVEDIFTPNPKLENTLNYYSRTYPQSAWGSLTSQARSSILAYARELQLLQGLDEGSALRTAQKEPAQDRLDIPATLAYFKSTYTSYGQLNEASTLSIQMLAEFLKQRSGFTSAGSIKIVMRVPLDHITDSINNAENGHRSTFSTVWHNELKPYIVTQVQNLQDSGVDVQNLFANL